MQPLIVTFRQHPRSVLQSDYVPQLLTSTDERLNMLESIAPVEAFDFAAIRELTAAEFMRRLHDEYDVRVLLMGYDHCFGSDRLRHPQDYIRLGEHVGIEVLSAHEFVDGEWHISSTEIRQALLTGNILVANELLGYPYSLSGIVTEGNHIGRTIGFPTANIQPDCPHKLLPKSGVYAVNLQSEIINHKSKIINHKFPTLAIANVGTNPTIGNSSVTIEVHIPDFHADLYGQRLTIRFVRFLRDEHKFSSLDALRAQIHADLSNL